jgi:hypothetical protein
MWEGNMDCHVKKREIRVLRRMFGSEGDEERRG